MQDFEKKMTFCEVGQEFAVLELEAERVVPEVPHSLQLLRLGPIPKPMGIEYNKIYK